MITVKAGNYTSKEKESLPTLFMSLSGAVCDYCASVNQDFGCPHKKCPFRHIIDDLNRVTTFYKK